MSNPFHLLNEWEDTEGHELESKDHPEWGYRWPYPTQYKVSLIWGPLAIRINKFFDIPYTDHKLYLFETITSGGWSDFTAEEEFDMEVWIIRKGSAKTLWDSEKQSKFYPSYDRENNLDKFIKLFG